MNNFKVINNKVELEDLIQNNFNDFNGNIIRKYEVGGVDLIKKIIETYREDIAFGIKLCGDFYSFYKDKSGKVYGRKAKQPVDKPITVEYDVCGSCQDVMNKFGI